MIFSDTTVKYYTDTVGATTPFPLDSSYLGASDNVAYWEENASIIIGGCEGTLDPSGSALAAIMADSELDFVLYDAYDIDAAQARFNALPSFLEIYFWDVSSDSPSSTSDNVVYMYRACLHETLHMLGVNHISSDVTAVLNEADGSGESSWVTELTNYDILA